MTDLPLPTGVWRFGVFEADLDAEELRKNGVKVHLQGQPFHVLSVLLVRSGRLVRRDELRREVWPENTFVEFDHALNTAVKKIRCALGDDAAAPRYVQTISRRGYRFIADVRPPTRNDLTRKADPSTVLAAPRDNNPPPWGFAGKAFVAFALTILMAFQLTHDSRAAQSQAERPMVLAILPFDNWSDDARLAYLGDSVSQELIMQFGRMDPSRLAVAARVTVQPYRHTSKTLKELGRELHADYLMQGSLRGDGQHTRVSAELVRVKDQARVWGDEFDLSAVDLLALETDLARSIGPAVRAIMFGPKA